MEKKLKKNIKFKNNSSNIVLGEFYFCIFAYKINIMILGQKFKEYTDYVEPFEKDYETLSEYAIAKAQFDVKNLFSFKTTALKTKVRRYENTELKKGSKVYIKRWDDNGIDGETEVLEVIFDEEYPKVICEDGWFHFNPHEEYHVFKWTAKGKGWEKKNQKWIKSADYYIEK